LNNGHLKKSGDAVCRQKPPASVLVAVLQVNAGKSHWAPCPIAIQRQRFLKIAEQERIAAHTADAARKRGDTQQKQHQRQHWDKSSQPSWLTEEFYFKQIQPQLATIELKTIAVTLGVSIPYASDIRAGQRRPHPRHWLVLAQIAGLGDRGK
jgi:hypothetical protein